MSVLTDLLRKIRPVTNYLADEPPVPEMPDDEPDSSLSGFTGALRAQKVKAAPYKKLLIYIPIIILVLAVSYWIMAGKSSRKLSLGTLPVGNKPIPPRQLPAMTSRTVDIPAPSQERPSPPPHKERPLVTTNQTQPQQNMPLAPESVISPAPTVTSPAAKRLPRAVISKRAEKEEVKDPEEQISPFILEDPFSQDATNIRNLKTTLEEVNLRLSIAKANAEIKKLMRQDEPPPGPEPALSMPPIGEEGLFSDDIWLKGIARSAYGELSAVLENNAGRWVVREGDVVDNRWVVAAIQDNKVILQTKGRKEKKELLLEARTVPLGGAGEMIPMPPQIGQERKTSSRQQAQ